jgi:hypothetical protein
MSPKSIQSKKNTEGNENKRIKYNPEIYEEAKRALRRIEIEQDRKLEERSRKVEEEIKIVKNIPITI